MEGFVDSNPIGFIKDTPGLIVRVTLTGRVLSKKFPTEGIIRSFMRQIKEFDDAEIDRRLALPGNNGLYDIVDGDTLFFEADVLDDVLKRKIELFGSKNGLKWKIDRFGGTSVVTFFKK